MSTNRKKLLTRKQYAPDKRPDETWVEFQRRKYPRFGSPKQRDETWEQFAERQRQEMPWLFNGEGPVAFTRPGPAGRPDPAARSSRGPASRPR